MDKTETKRKIAAYVGFAIKSGGVVYGLDSLKTARSKRPPALILADNASSEKTKKEAAFFAADRKIPLLIIDGLSDSLRKPNVKIMSILDKGLAARILETAKGLDGESES
ncbi:MAG: hypothetical protein LBP62_06875 [Clostridiales bacterium]|jgi:ribosomal protein L30E|nr:hypothetical protein [Clostridiales bacterium]